jgi:hypothetical protein
MQQMMQKQSPGREIRAQFKPSFKIFIACEDQAALVQARKVQRQLEALCGDEIIITPKFWNFALMRHEALREFAVQEAARADMIVISLRPDSEIPDHVKSWMDSLPVRPEAGRAALIALIGRGQERAVTLHPHVPYLRQIAERRGLDFFCNLNGGQLLDDAATDLQDAEDRMAPDFLRGSHIQFQPVF